MDKFYLNKKAQPNGDHEVHKEGCPYFPSPPHAQYLGVFISCHEAVTVAKQKYAVQSNGCFICARACNEE